MFEDDPEQIRLLFACEACSRNRHYDCAHLTVGAFCPCACPWMWRNEGDYPDGPTRVAGEGG